MKTFRKSFFLSFALWAVAIFLSLSLGGEFLHERIHHHETQASHDDCAISQLQTQLFVVLAFLCTAGSVYFCKDLAVPQGIFISAFDRIAAQPRAPPSA